MEMFVASFSAGSGGRQYRSWDSSGIQYGASVTLAGKTLLGPARVRHRLVTNTPTRPASLGSAAKIPLRLFFFFPPARLMLCSLQPRGGAVRRQALPAHLFRPAAGASTSCFRWPRSDGCHC